MLSARKAQNGISFICQSNRKIDRFRIRCMEPSARAYQKGRRVHIVITGPQMLCPPAGVGFFLRKI